MSDLIITRSVHASEARGRSGWDHLVAVVKLTFRAFATRRDLVELSDHQLADIGITRPTALAEAARLPWDIRPVRRWRQTGGL